MSRKITITLLTFLVLLVLVTVLAIDVAPAMHPLGTWAITSVVSADGTKATMAPGCEVLTISKDRIRDEAVDPMKPTDPPDISDDAYDIVTKTRSHWSIVLHSSETANGVTTRSDVPMTLTTTGGTLIYESAESRSVAVPYTDAMRAAFQAILDAIPKAKPGAPIPALMPGPVSGVIGGKTWTMTDAQQDHFNKPDVKELRCTLHSGPVVDEFAITTSPTILVGLPLQTGHYQLKDNHEITFYVPKDTNVFCDNGELVIEQVDDSQIVFLLTAEFNDDYMVSGPGTVLRKPLVASPTQHP